MTQQAERPLLSLRGIGRSFPSGEQEVQVLKDVDLGIGSGEMLAIVGASGSGKSTLMNILGCLDRPSAGTYMVSGKDVGALDSDAVYIEKPFSPKTLLERVRAILTTDADAAYGEQGS